MASSSLDTLSEIADEFFSVSLAGDEELCVLMRLLGIVLKRPVSLAMAGDFDAVFDYSDKFLPLMSTKDFDTFYERWLRLSGRQTSMDEYGQLLFFKTYALVWNGRSNRFILREHL